MSKLTIRQCFIFLCAVTEGRYQSFVLFGAEASWCKVKYQMDFAGEIFQGIHEGLIIPFADV